MNPSNDRTCEAGAPRLQKACGSFYWLRCLFGIPLLILGGGMTLVFCLIVCGYIVDRIDGGQPKPGLASLFITWVVIGAAPLALAILLLCEGIGRNPPSARYLLLRGWVAAGALLLFIAVGIDASFGPKNWHNTFRRQNLAAVQADDLRSTTISPHLEVDLDAGTNVLWCGTFQLAWNEVCDLVGGQLQFDPGNALVTNLNQRAFTKDCVDEASYVAFAGFVRDNIHARIQRAVTDKFRGAFTPRLIPEKTPGARPQDIVAYACLFKTLNFPMPFERLDDSLKFGEDRIRAFGMGQYNPSHHSMYPQVVILDYQSEDDFVIELKTKSEGERMILAKVEPQSNLALTVKRVRQRARDGNPLPAGTNDTLIVPRINFDLTRQYTELEGMLLLPQTNRIATDLRVLSAVQNTRFELNEKGVELRSESHIGFGCSAQPRPAIPHTLIFDKPFLIVLERADAPMPYFALWIGNTELLVPW